MTKNHIVRQTAVQSNLHNKYSIQFLYCVGLWLTDDKIKPPSTIRDTPFIVDAFAFDAKNKIAFATSSGWLTLPIGILFLPSSSICFSSADDQPNSLYKPVTVCAGLSKELFYNLDYIIQCLTSLHWLVHHVCLDQRPNFWSASIGLP